MRQNLMLQINAAQHSTAARVAMATVFDVHPGKVALSRPAWWLTTVGSVEITRPHQGATRYPEGAYPQGADANANRWAVYT